jgi:L-lactate dehydrogenase complex protein LldG
VVEVAVSDARAEILSRVRHALADVPGDESPEQVEVPRGYARGGRLSAAQTVELFAERVGEYHATVHRVAADGARERIEACCSERVLSRLVVPGDLPEHWRPAGIETVVDEGLGHRELDACDGVLTGCAAAIALTGTILLDGGPGQGRRAITLVPDYHLCLVRADQVAETVAEALARVAPRAGLPARPITLISGPSATSDIELRRVEGVHGPRTLDVLILE